MPNQQNIEKVNELTDTFKSAQCVAVTDYAGLTVEKATLLRSELRKKNIRYIVAKNTLMKIAAKEAGINGLDNYLTGPTAVALGQEDPGAMAKILFDFGKTNQKPQIRAIYIDGVVYGGADSERIAKLPGRDQLIAMVVGSVTAPLSGFVGTLDGIVRKFVGTLDAMKEKMAN